MYAKGKNNEEVHQDSKIERINRDMAFFLHSFEKNNK